MAMADSCCCGCSLRAGLFLIGVCHVIFIIAVGVLYGLEMQDVPVNEWDYTTYFIIGIVCLAFVISVLLFVGAGTKIVAITRIAAFLQFVYTTAVLMVAVLYLKLAEYEVGGTAVGWALIHFYFFTVVTAFATETIELQLATQKKGARGTAMTTRDRLRTRAKSNEELRTRAKSNEEPSKCDNFLSKLADCFD